MMLLRLLGLSLFLMIVGCGVDLSQKEDLVLDLKISHTAKSYNHRPWVFVYTKEKREDLFISISNKPDKNNTVLTCNAPDYLKKPYKNMSYGCAEIRGSGTYYYHAQQGWLGSRTPQKRIKYKIKQPSQDSQAIGLNGEPEIFQHIETMCEFDRKFKKFRLGIAKLAPQNIDPGGALVIQADMAMPKAKGSYDFNYLSNSHPEIFSLRAEDITLFNIIRRSEAQTLMYQTGSHDYDWIDGRYQRVPNDGACKIKIADFAPMSGKVSGTLSCSELPEREEGIGTYGPTFSLDTAWRCDSFR